MSLSSDTTPMRALQLEVARLKDENRDARDQIALQDLTQQLTPTTDLLALLDEVLATVLAVVGASAGSLLLADEDTGELVFTVVHGPARGRLTGFRIPQGQGIAGWVAANRKPQVLRDAHSDPRFSPVVDETFDFQTRSLAAWPLLDGERILGVVEALNKGSDREFSELDYDLLRVVAQLAAAALVRAESLTGGAAA